MLCIETFRCFVGGINMGKGSSKLGGGSSGIKFGNKTYKTLGGQN